MTLIGIFGYTEKIDLVTSFSKALQILGKTVLVIDATEEKKYKYVIPTIATNDKNYVCQYDNVDYAVGFDSMNDVENYLCDHKINISLYDYVIVDVDNEKTYEFFRSKTYDKVFFIIDTNILSYKKNIEILNAVRIYSSTEDKNLMTRIMYRGYITRTAEKYFEKLYKNLEEYKWDENELEIMENENDTLLYLDFLISGIIQFKKHSRDFINSVASMAAMVEENPDLNDIRRKLKKGGI